MLVIGSTAMHRALKRKGMPFREPADFDCICTVDEMTHYAYGHGLLLKPLAQYKVQGVDGNGTPKAEFEVLHESESGQRYIEYTKSLPSLDHMFMFTREKPIEIIYAPLEVLYSIKRSHRHYPRSWKKHVNDMMLLHKFYFYSDPLTEITKIREKETEVREGRLKTPSLAMDAKDFFDDNVSNRLFVHDEMHQIMANRAKPMFEYYKKFPGTDSVLCDKEKFFALPFVDQICGVQEEMYVIALERCLLPQMFLPRAQRQFAGQFFTTQDALDYAIMRICTNLCKGWFREFATMNYWSIIYSADKNYLDRFLQAVQDGRIKRVAEMKSI